MTLDEMKAQKSKWMKQLKILKGNSAMIRNARKILKENIEKIDMMIFKTESPEQFENYKAALQGYVNNTHIF